MTGVHLVRPASEPLGGLTLGGGTVWEPLSMAKLLREAAEVPGQSADD
jgi:hypothetical protein